MRWRKLGRIFDPSSFALANGCREFAQSPQALVFPEYVRIYFSTRFVDTSGKFLSHVAFVDFSREMREVIRVSQHTVIPLGDLGCFDEHGIFPISPVRVGQEIYAYTCGWSRRVSVSVETGIGLAISKDEGETFQRIGSGPVLSASLHEPCLVGDGYVKIVDGIFHMWYIFGTEWRKYSNDSPPDRVYKIGHATSHNGVNWIKEEGRQIIADHLGEDECQALPTVIRIDSRYHMLFCYRYSFDFRKSKGRGYRIGHAWSEDLTNWTRDDDGGLAEGQPDEWDSDMQCYPSMFEMDDNVFVLYNGNHFGRFGFGAAVLER
jgi:hypothetical protein